MDTRVKSFNAVYRFRAPFCLRLSAKKCETVTWLKFIKKKKYHRYHSTENVLMFNVRLAFNQKPRLQLRFRQPQRHISDLQRAELLQN